jgi:hypothetical protein
MVCVSFSPLEQVALGVRQNILDAWLYDALEAYEHAALLLGDDSEHLRIRAARQGLISTDLLEQSHAALMSRYVLQVSDGRQLCLFTDDHNDELRQRWCRFAIAFMRRRPQRQRWVLQATVGLGTVGRTHAANQLFQEVLDAPLGPC